MSAFIRIYTQLGKEHVCYAEAYQLKSNMLILLDNEINCIKHIIKGGQPCNIHIRYEDQDIETECILKGCTLTETQEIQFETSKIDIIRYKGIQQ